MLTSAKIAHVWQRLMDHAGYTDDAFSTTEFNNIGFAYTRRISSNGIKYGQFLWDTLMEYFNDGSVRLSLWDIRLVTRNHEFWDK